MPLSVLALDLATHTGWALSTGPSGALDLKPHTSDYGLADGVFRAWLADVLAANNVGTIVVEPPVLRGAASILLVGLYWSAQAVAAAHGVARTDADSNRVRRWLLGAEKLRELRRGGSKATVRKRLKNAVIEAMLERGCHPNDDDEADALAMLHWHLEGRQ